MSSNDLVIFPMSDKTYDVKKDLLFNLPMRLLICGKSQLSGKTTLIANLLARKQFYKDDFKSQNIYIISPSAKTDEKWVKLIEYREIPEENIFDSYDESEMKVLYKFLEDDYNDAIENEEEPQQKLIIFDDVAYSGDLHSKKNKTIDKIANQGRHFLISCIMVLQYYTQASPNFRANVSGLIIFGSTQKQWDSIADEHNTLSNRKEFIKKMKEATEEKHSFICINYTNEKEHRYMKNFVEPLVFDVKS